MIVVTPPAIPVKIPAVASIVPVAGVLLLQVPPPPSLRMVISPAHRLRLPDIAPGAGLTVRIAVVEQPVPGKA